MRRVQIAAIAVCCSIAAGLAHGAGIGQVHVEWVDIGDPGNPENTYVKIDYDLDSSTGYGSVAYEFRISKYEVTNNQYVSFLNAIAASDPNGLYRTEMGTAAEGGILRSGTSGNYSYSTKTYFGNKPVIYASFYDGARLANWLQNGQQQDASTTEYGAYTFSGTTTLSSRNPGAAYYIPNEHEWQKAAFYEAGANTVLGDGWWRGANGTELDIPVTATVDAFGNVTNPGPNTVNRNKGTNWNGSVQGNVTTVGSAGATTPYGVYDMAGNVFEWVENDLTKPDPNGWGPYGVLGGSYRNFGHFRLYERNLAHHDNHAVENKFSGLRLAAAGLSVIPEPSSFALVSVATFAFMSRRRSRRTRRSS